MASLAEAQKCIREKRQAAPEPAKKKVAKKKAAKKEGDNG